jgi:DNA-binding beta-propeller fold protein YncE
MAFLPGGAAVIVEMVSSNRVVKIDRGVNLSVLTPAREKGFDGDGRFFKDAAFNGLHNVASSATGDLFLADTWNNRVRKVDARSGRITTLAGTGRKGFSGDGGPAAAAAFSSVIHVALSPDGGQLFVTDIDNRRVRRIDLKGGIVTTVAGNGESGVPNDGARATEAPLVDPRAVAVAADGGFFVLERAGHALRKVDSEGRITTVAGTGKPGTGEDGPALETPLNGPKFIAMDTDGSVLIADAENHLIRRYDPQSRRLTRVAGTGKPGSGGIGGPPEKCELNRPHGVLRGPDGRIYIVDSYNDRVLRIDP